MHDRLSYLGKHGDNIMKKIYLFAYDRKNLGDDLFIQAIASRYPKNQFYIWSDQSNKKVFNNIKNLYVINKNSHLVRVLKWIRPSLVSRYRAWTEKRCLAVVYIGGSIFIEYDNWKQMITWWEYEVKNRSFYILGANFGPFKTEEYYQSMKNVFASAEDVCFRDCYSKKLFETVDTVRYAPDILFDVKFPKRQKKEKRVFISVIDCESRADGAVKFKYESGKYNILLQQLIEVAYAKGYKVTLASFCKEEGDERAIERIVSNTNHSVDVIKYIGINRENILQSMADSDFIVASRFHAAILGFAANKPVLPVIYSDKTSNVLKDIGFEGMILDIRNLQYEQNKIEKIFENSNSQKLTHIDELRQMSEQHFLKLDEAIMGMVNDDIG